MKTDEEGYVKCPNTISGFEKMVKWMDFKDTKDFIQETGIHFEDIKGKYIMLIHNRVYLRDQQ
jgi:hypothetical protein